MTIPHPIPLGPFSLGLCALGPFSWGFCSLGLAGLAAALPAQTTITASAVAIDPVVLYAAGNQRSLPGGSSLANQNLYVSYIDPPLESSARLVTQLTIAPGRVAFDLDGYVDRIAWIAGFRARLDFGNAQQLPPGTPLLLRYSVIARTYYAPTLDIGGDGTLEYHFETPRTPNNVYDYPVVAGANGLTAQLGVSVEGEYNRTVVRCELLPRPLARATATAPSCGNVLLHHGASWTHQRFTAQVPTASAGDLAAIGFGLLPPVATLPMAPGCPLIDRIFGVEAGVIDAQGKLVRDFPHTMFPSPVTVHVQAVHLESSGSGVLTSNAFRVAGQ